MFTYSLQKHQIVLFPYEKKAIIYYTSILHANGRANKIKLNEKSVYFRVKCMFKSVEREFG